MVHSCQQAALLKLSNWVGQTALERREGGWGRESAAASETVGFPPTVKGGEK